MGWVFFNVGLSGSDAYQMFEEGRIDLYVTNSAMSGMYRCDIETSENVREPFYVGLYLSSEGMYNCCVRVKVCFINPRRACAARVTVVVLCVCVCVCVCVSAALICDSRN